MVLMAKKTQCGTPSIACAVWLALAGCSESHTGIGTDSGPSTDSGPHSDSGAGGDGGARDDGGAGGDSGTGNAAADAHVDASNPAAACEAGQPLCSDASATCRPIDQSYKFFFDGGLSPSSYASELAPEGTYQRVRTVGTSISTCNATLPACGSAGVDVGELSAALSNPDVTAAFDAATADLSMAYGRDSRPVDGQVFVVQRSSAKRFAVGDPCNGASGCRAIPQGVSELVSLLKRLYDEQSASGPCAGF